MGRRGRGVGEALGWRGGGVDSSVLKGKCSKRTPSGGSVGRRGVYGAKPPAGSWGIALVGGREHGPLSKAQSIGTMPEHLYQLVCPHWSVF